MSQSGQPGRRTLALLLYLFAALGALACVAELFLIRDNIRRHADTGDYAGASLAIAFLVIAALPATLIALALALWLNPPWNARAAGSASVGPRRARPVLALLLVFAGLVPLAVAGFLLTNALRGAATDYHFRGAALFALALQDLVIFSPLILLAGLLFWIAARVGRPSRRQE